MNIKSTNRTRSVQKHKVICSLHNFFPARSFRFDSRNIIIGFSMNCSAHYVPSVRLAAIRFLCSARSMPSLGFSFCRAVSAGFRCLRLIHFIIIQYEGDRYRIVARVEYIISFARSIRAARERSPFQMAYHHQITGPTRGKIIFIFTILAYRLHNHVAERAALLRRSSSSDGDFLPRLSGRRGTPPDNFVP